MKKFLGLMMLLVAVGWCISDGSAQTQHRRKSNSANSGGGATTGARTGRGRYVTRNGKRIWVPQGSPAVGIRNQNSNSSPRRVVEREQLELEAVPKKPSTNTNRP